ncbi:MAG: TspO/MBR family protein [Armatimonadota bacterium]
MKAALQLIICVVVCFAAGGIGSLAMGRESFVWYRSLVRPAITPPSWVFGPAWSVLYLLMGIALFLVWRRAGQVPVGAAIGVFAAQLVLNALWTPAFFGMRSPALGLAVIIPLEALIAVCVVLFWRISPAAGALLLPYLGWTGFAAVLNGLLFVMNR